MNPSPNELAVLRALAAREAPGSRTSGLSISGMSHWQISGYISSLHRKGAFEALVSAPGSASRGSSFRLTDEARELADATRGATREEQYRAAAHIVTSTPPSSPNHRDALRALVELVMDGPGARPTLPECHAIVRELIRR